MTGKKLSKKEIAKIINYPKMPFGHGQLLNRADAQVIVEGVYRADYTVECGQRSDYYRRYFKINKGNLYLATGNTTEPLYVLDEDEKCWRTASFVPADKGVCLTLKEYCYDTFYRCTTKLS